MSQIVVYSDRAAWEAAGTGMVAALGSDEPDAIRFLALRNEIVSRLNQSLHKATYGAHAPAFIRGSTVITQEAVKNPFKNEEMLFGSSRELKIKEAWDFNYVHPESIDATPFSCWRLIVSADGESSKTIQALDPSSKEHFDRTLKILAASATAESYKGKGQSAWAAFWRLKDSFCKLQPHWAMTVHKSQGSQFGTVFIDSQDLDRSPGGADEKRRLWYTALTRAQHCVCLIADQEAVK